MKVRNTFALPPRPPGGASAGGMRGGSTPQICAFGGDRHRDPQAGRSITPGSISTPSELNNPCHRGPSRRVDGVDHLRQVVARAERLPCGIGNERIDMKFVRGSQQGRFKRIPSRSVRPLCDAPQVSVGQTAFLARMARCAHR